VRSSRPDIRSRHRGRPALLIAAGAIVAALVSPVTTAAVAASSGYTASRIPIPAVEPTGLAVNSATDTVYIGAATGVTVVNGATGSITATISLGSQVVGIAVDAATNMVYVAASNAVDGASGVDVINGATNSVVARIAEPAQAAVTGIAVDSSSDAVYVVSPTAATVTVIDGATNAVKTTVSTGSVTHPYGVAVDDVTHVVWVADEAGSVIAVDGTTDSITKVITLSSGEMLSVAVNTATDTVYATDDHNGKVAVIDGQTGTVTSLIPAGPAVFGIGVDQASDVVYASTNVTSAGATWVIDGTTNHVLDTIDRGGETVAVDQQTGTMYATSWRFRSMWVIAASAANAWSPVMGTGNATFAIGVPVTLQISASALPAADITYTGQLPSGLTLSSAGTLTGTPAAGTVGTYPITLTASNGVAPDYSSQLTLTIDQLPVITSGASATFRVGSAGQFALTATGVPVPSFYSSGSLPAGVAVLDQSPLGWQLAGTPAAGSGGVYPITINASNVVGAGVPQAFTLTVREAPAFTSPRRAAFTAGDRHRFTFRTSGYPAAKLSERGGLPRGITFKAGPNGTAVLAGTPPRADKGKTFKITIYARNGVGPRIHETFTLKIT
jgi:large repetitive protein